MQNYYAWYGTRLHLILEDDIADAFNRATDKFAAAQKKFKDEYGIAWDPTQNHALDPQWTEDELGAWNSISRYINLLVEINGGALDISEEELTSEYLVKL